eukprot:g5840.t1
MGDDSAGIIEDERPPNSGPAAEEAAEDAGGGDEDWEDADSSDGETFFMDPDGRVPFAGEMSFDFRSAPKALTAALAPPEALARVVKDCQCVATARAFKMAYSTGRTYWVQSDALPRNSLERLALDIFEAHTAGARFNRATSGAEWWTQVIKDSDDIGWHWDKDYGMEAQGLNVHPCLATVTYLSTNGGPTVILEKKGPMTCADVPGVSGEASKAWISQPSLGKHICFDGRYLHAAPADLARPRPPPADVGSHRGRGETNGADGKKRDNDGKPKAAANDAVFRGSPAECESNNIGGGGGGGGSGDGKGGGDGRGGGDGNAKNKRGKRVTFLVNVWLNHTPRTASPLDEDTAAKLGRPRLAASLAPGDFVPPKVLRVQGQEPQAETTTAEAFAVTTTSAAAVDMRWEFGEVGDEGETHLRHQVVVPVPDVLLPLAASGGSGPPSEVRLEAKEAIVGVASASAAAGVGVGGSAGEGDDRDSFCVQYPSASRKPTVSRMDAGDFDEEEEGSSSSEEEEDEDEDEGT